MDTTKKPIYCKVCFEEIKRKPYRGIIENKPILCDNCISQINKKLEVRKIFGVKVLFLSDYHSIMKSWLLNYKEYLDVELAPCFLNVFYPIIKFFTFASTIVPCPSSQKNIEKRGFDHLSLMLEKANLPYENLLVKESKIDQKLEKAATRLQDKGIHLKKDIPLSFGKRYVLFDDVFTTGSTFHQSLEELKKLKPKEIKGLILLDNEHLEERKLK